MNNSKTAILLGASGLTGGFLLEKLLNDDRYKKVNIYTRRKLEIKHEKLNQYICDLQNLEELTNIIQGDEAFCCIGTTKKKTPNKEDYKNIDYKIPLNLALACKSNNISKLFIISALGANKNSKFFYNRIKGEMEKDVKEVGIKNTFFFRPSLLLGERKEKRFLESLGIYLFRLLPKSHRGIDAKLVAKSMLETANSNCIKPIIKNEDML